MQTSRSKTRANLKIGSGRSLDSSKNPITRGADRVVLYIDKREVMNINNNL